MKKSLCFAVLAYSLILMICGILGYQKGSPSSLYAGTGLGFLLFLSSIGLFFQKKAALYTASFLTACFTAVFVIRYFKVEKNFLAILAILSGLMLCYLLLHLARWRKIS